MTPPLTAPCVLTVLHCSGNLDSGRHYNVSPPVSTAASPIADLVVSSASPCFSTASAVSCHWSRWSRSCDTELFTTSSGFGWDWSHQFNRTIHCLPSSPLLQPHEGAIPVSGLAAGWSGILPQSLSTDMSCCQLCPSLNFGR